jgi:hypothetical protein
LNDPINERDTMKKHASKAFLSAALCAVAIGGLSAGASPASAASVTGWVGPAGINYLHTSTIVNAPDLYAESRVYSTFGATSAPGKLGVRPRLFKSGALCEAVDYSYNYFAETAWSQRTTATCGSGSYNSHGFVAVWNDSKAAYDEFVTFPSNPLNWTAPTARTAKTQAVVTDADRQSGVNAAGETFGSAATDTAAAPDLVLAIGTNGEVGYVRSTQLDQGPANDPNTAATATPTTRSIPLLQSDGQTEIGSFLVK